MNEKWDKRMMDLARLVATWSKDPSTKVGAVVTAGREILGIGYNGFPRAVHDDEDRYNDRSIKYKLIVHAEVNALITASAHGRMRLAGCTLYTTKPPCSECTKLLLQYGLCELVYPAPPDDASAERWAADGEWSQLMLAEANIMVRVL